MKQRSQQEWSLGSIIEALDAGRFEDDTAWCVTVGVDQWWLDDEDLRRCPAIAEQGGWDAVTDFVRIAGARVESHEDTPFPDLPPRGDCASWAVHNPGDGWWIDGEHYPAAKTSRQAAWWHAQDPRYDSYVGEFLTVEAHQRTRDTWETLDGSTRAVTVPILRVQLDRLARVAGFDADSAMAAQIWMRHDDDDEAVRLAVMSLWDDAAEGDKLAADILRDLGVRHP